MSDVNVTGVEQVIVKANKVSKDFSKEIKTLIKITGQRIRDTAKSKAQARSLARSVRIESRRRGFSKLIGFTQHSIGPFVELGTGTRYRKPPEATFKSKSKKQRYWPPITARRANLIGERGLPGITGWVYRHRQSFGFKRSGRVSRRTQSELPRRAFLVARGIYRRGGTDPKPFLYPAYRQWKPRYLIELQKLAAHI